LNDEIGFVNDKILELKPHVSISFADPLATSGLRRAVDPLLVDSVGEEARLFRADTEQTNRKRLRKMPFIPFSLNQGAGEWPRPEPMARKLAGKTTITLHSPQQEFFVPGPEPAQVGAIFHGFARTKSKLFVFGVSRCQTIEPCL
jgi:hypothetical protein